MRVFRICGLGLGFKVLDLVFLRFRIREFRVWCTSGTGIVHTYTYIGTSYCCGIFWEHIIEGL